MSARVFGRVRVTECWSQVKGLQFPGCHDAKYCRLVMHRSKLLMKPVSDTTNTLLRHILGNDKHHFFLFQLDFFYSFLLRKQATLQLICFIDSSLFFVFFFLFQWIFLYLPVTHQSSKTSVPVIFLYILDRLISVLQVILDPKFSFNAKVMELFVCVCVIGVYLVVTQHVLFFVQVIFCVRISSKLVFRNMMNIVITLSKKLEIRPQNT